MASDEQAMREELNALREQMRTMEAGFGEKLRGVETSVSDKFATLKEEVRVLKHDFAGFQQVALGFSDNIRLLADKIDSLRTDLFNHKLKTEKGAGYVAGIIGALTVSAGALMTLVKMLFDRAAH